MPIIYSLVARNSIVLANYTDTKGNFQTVSQRLLEKIDSSLNTKASYIYDNYLFHILVEGGITYLCMCDKDFANRVAFSFLTDIRDRFKQTYGERAKTAPSMSFNSDFSRVLTNQMTYWSNNPNSDKITKVRGQIDEVKGIMIDNIDKVLDRGEKIQLLVEKSESLNQTANSFRYKSTKLKRTMWIQNFKLLLILICIIITIIVVVVAVLFWFVCGFPDLYRCLSLFR